MPQPRRQGITDALRQRLLGALASGALREGARLPSTRELARDLKADPRVVAEAYRVLAGEGLVELRPRSGVFLSARPGGNTAGPTQGVSPQWLADVVADGIRLGVPRVIIDMRPDLLSPDWRLLLTRVAYAVIADQRFAPLVHAFVEGAEGARNLRVLVAGRDDLSEIPPDAPTYITEAARERIGRHRLPGRVVMPARTLSDASTRAIALTVVQAQLAPARGRGARRALAAAR